MFQRGTPRTRATSAARPLRARTVGGRRPPRDRHGRAQLPHRRPWVIANIARPGHPSVPSRMEPGFTFHAHARQRESRSRRPAKSASSSRRSHFAHRDVPMVAARKDAEIDDEGLPCPNAARAPAGTLCGIAETASPPSPSSSEPASASRRGHRVRRGVAQESSCFSEETVHLDAGPGEHDRKPSSRRGRHRRPPAVRSEWLSRVSSWISPVPRLSTRSDAR